MRTRKELLEHVKRTSYSLLQMEDDESDIIDYARGYELKLNRTKGLKYRTSSAWNFSVDLLVTADTCPIYCHNVIRISVDTSMQTDLPYAVGPILPNARNAVTVRMLFAHGQGFLLRAVNPGLLPILYNSYYPKPFCLPAISCLSISHQDKPCITLARSDCLVSADAYCDVRGNLYFAFTGYWRELEAT